MPTFTHGKGAQLYIADSGATLRNFTTVANTAGLDKSIETAETTVFGNAAKTYLAGLLDATFSAEGLRDATFEGYLDGIAGLSTTWRYFPEGSASGKVQFDGTAIMTAFKQSSDLSKATDWSAEFQVSGTVTRTVL